MPNIGVTLNQLARAFTEWEKRRREEPEQFQSQEELAEKTPEASGAECASYFLTLLKT